MSARSYHATQASKASSRFEEDEIIDNDVIFLREAREAKSD